MKKNLVTVIATFVAGLFLIGGLAIAGEPGKVKLDNGEGKKSAVEFDHKAHTARAADCKACHHKGDNKKCFECHKLEASDTSKVTLKNASHKTCKDCHKKEKKGPTSCKGCHK